MTIFISCPMEGKTNEEILLHTLSPITRMLKERHGEETVVIDGWTNEDKPPLWLLGNALQRLSEADAIFMAKGWEDARGCKLERKAAKAYGKQVIYE